MWLKATSYGGNTVTNNIGKLLACIMVNKFVQYHIVVIVVYGSAVIYSQLLVLIW